MDTVVIPPVRTIKSRTIPFHIYYDSEYLSETSNVTQFFMNPRAFANQCKHYKTLDECNLPGMGQCIQQGYQKDVRWISLQVADAMDPDSEVEFEIRLMFAQLLTPWLKIYTGHTCAVELYISYDVRACKFIEDKTAKTLTLRPLEQFCVEVRAPEASRGKYARVSLHGPLTVAVDS